MKVTPFFKQILGDLNDLDDQRHPDEALLDLCDQFCDRWEALPDNISKSQISRRLETGWEFCNLHMRDLLVDLGVIIKTPARCSLARDSKLRVLQSITSNDTPVSQLVAYIASDYFCRGFQRD